MNPKIEFNSVLWVTLDPTTSLETARLKVQHLTDEGIMFAGIRITIPHRDLLNINTYTNLIKTVVSIQQSELYKPIVINEPIIIGKYKFYLHQIKKVLDPDHEISPAISTWAPFMDVEIDYLGLQLVPTIWNLINKPFADSVNLELQTMMD